MELEPNFNVIECSPNTFRRIQTDMEYRNQLAENASQNTGIYTNMTVEGDASPVGSNMVMEESENLADFIPIDDEVVVPEGPETVPGGSETAPEGGWSGVYGRDLWLEAPTKLLLAYLQELRPKIGKTYALKNKSKMWNLIQTRLAQEGYTFTVTQVQGKFRSLERRYKQTQLHNGKSGRDRQTCPYYSELKTLLKNDKGLHPEYLLESNEALGTSRESLVNISSADEIERRSTYPSDSDATSPILPKRKKPETALEKMQKTIQEISTEQKDFNQEIVSLLKRKNEIEQKRNEIFEEMCKQMQKK